MSTAMEMLRSKIQEFEMPSVSIGTPVRYYPQGTVVEGRLIEMAFVTQLGMRSVSVRTAKGVWMDTVRHINDPKLQLNADQRASGAWDFTVEQLQRAAWEADVERRISALEAREPEPVKRGPTNKAGQSYHDLRREAKALGVKFRGNPAKKWLEAQVAKVKERRDGQSESPAESARVAVAGEGRDGQEGQMGPFPAVR